MAENKKKKSIAGLEDKENKLDKVSLKGQ